MRVFLSYRRDDTAGRAGRLHDALVSRLGPRNIFMDVAAIEVGTDFVDQVDRAIAGSDVSLVVIGPNWLGGRDADGRRRLDDPDDHVRAEVRSALASNNPVVPVLVGGATLPSEKELPSDLLTLVRRQAVELHDETWAHDVEMLIRRLEGKDLVRVRRRLVPVAVGFVVIGVAALLVWRAQVSGDDESVGECDSAPNEFWTSVDVSPSATAVDEIDGTSIRYTVRHVDFKAEGSGWQVVVEVEAYNETTGDGNQSGHYYDPADFDAVLVDGFATPSPNCFSVLSGDRDDVTPGLAASGLVGFNSTRDPTGAALALETESGVRIPITSRT